MDELSLDSVSGMFGLLGPNGAGKSSLMRTIATLQLPDSGEIFFNDINVLNEPMELRKILGYLPQDFGVYQGESAERLLDYFSILKGITSKKERSILVDQVLELTNLYEARKKSVSSYSGGMKRRFGIAQLLLNDPKLIIVDEPTAGLDPAERTRFLNVIRAIGSVNTVILSTHIVADVNELCHDMAIINKGQVVNHLKPQDGILQLKGNIWGAKINPERLPEFERSLEVLSSSYTPDNFIFIRVYENEKSKLDSIEANWESLVPELGDVYFHSLKDSKEYV